ncbi:succinyl-diaminopimelate desuccinylase [Sphingomonas sp. AP4-R1]|uniref:succinyl-diaminopimelate desuccinylase n=1 Tax=Sphingomonas sp. AP4-R1 TaxID=2735134 RepID=UPI0014938F50|nr:succinyl-diaminopimelate desuccinylase [Sphingomonas sp. AP4-R1]QJU58930.1 succinyl-diaminopimelate desuccinylase [Sphingomonas sp. AP4-R1]
MPEIDPLDFTTQLLACNSVTPADGGTQAVLADALTSIGFEVHRFHHGEAPDGPIANLFATRGNGGRHFAFAGHTDVVPPGEGWESDAFTPTVRGELLYGRGAVDMKGAIGAFVAAASRGQPDDGTLSLIITGDEEGPATYGTKALMAWMAEKDIRPDMILVGEPTSSARLGDTIKIGRRGSVNMWIEVPGVQGHVAYPHLASNPIPALASVLTALSAMPLDPGTDWFQPSNLEITEIAADNPAANVIPGHARARLNIRFNDTYRGGDLIEQVREIVAGHAPEATLTARISGEAFLTAPGPLSTLVADAISDATGLAPELSTSGGTSDARFLSTIAPTVEFGLLNATMHKLDEAVAIPDLHMLADIYATIIRRALAN